MKSWHMDEPCKYAKWNEWASYKRTNILLFHLYGISRIGKFIEQKCRLEATRGCGEGKMRSYCLMGTEFLFGMIKMFANNNDVSCIILWMYLIPLNCILING